MPPVSIDVFPPASSAPFSPPRDAPAAGLASVRIVYLSASGELGGAERLLLDLLATVRAARPAWGLRLLAAEEGPLGARAAELGVEVETVPFPPVLARLGDSAAAAERGSALSLLPRALGAARGVAGYAARLHRALAEARPDVVHSNGYKMHVLGAWAGPRGTPLLWHLHDFVTPRPVMSRLLRAHLRGCAAAVANSRAVADDARAACGPGLPVRVVHNAVDLEAYAPGGAAADLDALSGLPPAAPGTVRVGLVATAGRFKGHDVFLRALARLPAGLPVRGYVVSGPVYATAGSQFSLEELRALARELGIAERVGFTGFLADTAAAMRGLDVVVHASTRPEPFGLVVVEGMACGRAVVASLAGGVPEIVTPGRDALAHPPGDDAALAECIRALAEDPALRERLGREGRRTAEARFGRERLAEEMVPVYERLAARREG